MTWLKRLPCGGSELEACKVAACKAPLLKLAVGDWSFFPEPEQAAAEREHPTGVSMILGSLIASALAARLSDIHAELIRTQRNCEPFQWTDPRIATPFALATVLGVALLVLTAYGSARALSIVRSPAAPAAERGGPCAYTRCQDRPTYRMGYTEANFILLIIKMY